MICEIRELGSEKPAIVPVPFTFVAGMPFSARNLSCRRCRCFFSMGRSLGLPYSSAEKIDNYRNPSRTFYIYSTPSYCPSSLLSKVHKARVRICITKSISIRQSAVFNCNTSNSIITNKISKINKYRNPKSIIYSIPPGYRTLDGDGAAGGRLAGRVHGHARVDAGITPEWVLQSRRLDQGKCGSV